MDLATLNPPQREAVLHGDGALLVLAGAGSGKTRVITFRVARLVERGIPAKAICALSFTNKAAEEMRERIGRLVGAGDAGALTLCTFHALGLAILKQERKALGHPAGFTIYDGADQLGVIREVLREVRADDRRFDPKAILHRISRAKNAFVGPDDYQPAEDSDYDRITRLVYPRYQRAMRAFAAVDFDDLIVEPVRLMARDEGVRQRWGGRFWYLLVDEYQDTNRAQLLFLDGLAARHGNVTVVGDDDQSIYGWRGAEASNILEFERHFPGAHVIKLEQNYRSTPTILAAANAVIEHNAARRAKTLFSDRRPGDPVVVVGCADSDAEAKFVCDEIERLRAPAERGGAGGERRRYQDCAVLYRSNLQARPLEEALRARRIPYELFGGQKFYERKEVKDVIAYLKVALSAKDEISLRRVVNYPARGIGVAALEKAAGRGGALWDGFAALAAEGNARVGAFLALVERARAALRAGRGAAGTARTLVEEIGLYDDVRAASPSPAAAQRRVDNVEDLLRSLAEHERSHPGASALADYLHRLTLDANDDDAAEGGDRVTLTTLHGAKGLEWPVVFLVGVEEELLPHARTLYPQGPDAELELGPCAERRVGRDAGPPDVSEERRLAYVGITRARERLYLSHARQRRRHGADRPREPSRFLAEIPAELCCARDLVAEARAPVEKDELRSFFQAHARD